MMKILRYILFFMLMGCTETKHITENKTESIIKKGIHIDAMPIWITFSDTTIYKDSIKIYIQFDTSTIKLIEK